MEKFITATGKTIDLAIAAALEQLGMDRDSVSVEVLENPRSGFLGIGSTPAKVKVTYEVPDEKPEAPAPALSSASRSKPKKPAAPAQEAQAAGRVIAPAAPPQPKPAPRAEQPRRERPERAERPERRERNDRNDRRERPERAERPERREAPAAVPAEPKVYAPAEPGSMEEKIELFIKGLLEHMDSDAVPHAFKSGEGYSVDLVGANLGVLIGRRGETLDAIQHLTNYAVNRGASKRVRINVDAENYRLKREESLQRLAVKVAGKVTRYRRNITLEPMNAYERHVIHAALQDHPDVTTFSTGTEPNRRIVVAYSRNKPAREDAE